jgi:hypothetical protein
MPSAENIPGDLSYPQLRSRPLCKPKRTHGYALSLLHNNRHIGGTVVAQPKELEMGALIAKFRIHGHFARLEIQTKKFPFMQVQEVIRAVRIGALGKHDRLVLAGLITFILLLMLPNDSSL